jgi:hypothetical protein
VKYYTPSGHVTKTVKYQLGVSWAFLEFIQAQLDPLYRYISEQWHVGTYCQASFILSGLDSVGQRAVNKEDFEGMKAIARHMMKSAIANLEAEAGQVTSDPVSNDAVQFALLVQELAGLRQRYHKKASDTNKIHFEEQLLTHFRSFFQDRLNVEALLKQTGYNAQAFVMKLQTSVQEFKYLLHEAMGCAYESGKAPEVTYRLQNLVNMAMQLSAPGLLNAVKQLLVAMSQTGSDADWKAVYGAVEQELIHLETSAAFAIRTNDMRPTSSPAKLYSDAMPGGSGPPIQLLPYMSKAGFSPMSGGSPTIYGRVAMFEQMQRSGTMYSNPSSASSTPSFTGFGTATGGTPSAASNNNSGSLFGSPLSQFHTPQGTPTPPRGGYAFGI